MVGRFIVSKVGRKQIADGTALGDFEMRMLRFEMAKGRSQRSRDGRSKSMLMLDLDFVLGRERVGPEGSDCSMQICRTDNGWVCPV